MVSEVFRQMEEKTAEALILHDDFIRELSFKLNLDKAIIKLIIYHTCITTGDRPVEVAHIVNEFHANLYEMTHLEEDGKAREDDNT